MFAPTPATLGTIMSLQEFMAAQAQNAQVFSQAPHFASLVPLVDRMYTTACAIAPERHSPTLVKLMMLCHREFLVAASQIQRGMPFDWIRCENRWGRSDRVRRADHRSQSLQMATLSGRDHHVVRALVSSLPDFGGTDG